MALDAITYLQSKVGAKEFATLDLSGSFDFNSISVEHGLVQSHRPPLSKFYHWEDKSNGRDLIIFEGDSQPITRSYELARQILNFACQYGVEQVYTMAAALIDAFEVTPKVWVTATDAHLLGGEEKPGLALKGDFHIRGMNGLLPSVAKEMGLKSVCLLGETPYYLGDISNPFASMAVLNALVGLLGLKVDMREFRERTARAHQTIDKLTRETQRDFLDQFTISLWEQPKEDD